MPQCPSLSHYVPCLEPRGLHAPARQVAGFLKGLGETGYVQGSNFAKQYSEKFILLLAGKDALPSFNCGGRINHDTPANKISESATSCAVRL